MLTMMQQGQGPYAKLLKVLEQDIKDIQKRVNEKIGVKESDTGLAAPNLWDIPADKQRMQEEQPLQVYIDVMRISEQILNITVRLRDVRKSSKVARTRTLNMLST